jgi:hypothetical protein
MHCAFLQKYRVRDDTPTGPKDLTELLKRRANPRARRPLGVHAFKSNIGMNIA